MAFLINGAILYDMEFRGSEGGVSKKTGKPWVTHKFEDKEARQLEVSVPEDARDKYPSTYFERGKHYTLSVRCVAGRTSSYVQLLDVWDTPNGATAVEY